MTESPNETILPTTNIIDSARHVWTLGATVPHGYVLLRDGMQFAGGQGVLLLYYGHKVYTKNDLGQWFVATDTLWLAVMGDPRFTELVKGLDVSLDQTTVDWTKVKVSENDFAFIQATQSNTITDPYFTQNWRGAKSVGLPRGAYHFYRFAATPQSQADRLLSALGDDLGELPIVLDLEDTQPMITPNLDDAKVFVNIIQNTTHRKVMIYTAKWWFDKYQLVAPDWMKTMDLWVASYQVGLPVLPDGLTRWVFWQYTSSGIVDGIGGAVDLDEFNGDRATFDDYLKTVAIQPPAPPTAWRGLHMRADGNSTDQDFQCITIAKLNGAKLMTNTAFSELDRLIALVPADHIALRLFAAGDDPILGNAQNFFNVQEAWLNYFNSKDGKWIEVHNEPNLPQEGLGVFWKDANGFIAWYAQVYNLIKAQYPNLKVTMGGLSPQPNVDAEWLPMMQANIGQLDWVAAHSYFGSEADMNDPNGGRYYRRFLPLGKPIIITEFANVYAKDDDSAKGQQYRAYYDSLESGVWGACCFVSSASDKSFNTTRQTWVRHGVISGIPYQMAGGAMKSYIGEAAEEDDTPLNDVAAQEFYKAEREAVDDLISDCFAALPFELQELYTEYLELYHARRFEAAAHKWEQWMNEARRLGLI